MPETIVGRIIGISISSGICGLIAGWDPLKSVPIVRFAWSLEEDSVPADKYGARFEEEVEKKRGIQKERENRGKRGFSIRCILSILHPCPDNQAIREIGLINGDWLLDSIPVNHRCWLRSTASSHSFVNRVERFQIPLRGYFDHPRIEINPLQWKERERKRDSLLFLSPRSLFREKKFDKLYHVFLFFHYLSKHLFVGQN